MRRGGVRRLIPRLALSCLVLSIALATAAPESLGQTAPRTPAEAGGGGDETPARGDTVRNRARPGYDPVGLRAGGFFLYPEVSVIELYRSNIFYTPSNEEEDFVTEISPSLRAQSNWNVHSLTFYAEAEHGRYLLNEDENYLDFRGGVDGRLDVRHDLVLSGGLSAARRHEARSSPEQAGAAEPVTYMRYDGETALSKSFNKLSTRIGGEVAVLRYDNVPASDGGTFRSKDRDRTESEASFRVGYEFTPRIEPFVRTSVNDRSYRQHRDDAGQVRDSWGWETVGGAAFDLGSVAVGEVYVGYLNQSYEAAGFEDVSGFSFGGEIVWNPQRLTTVTVNAERSVEETTLAGASGALQSSLDARVDHELRRNVILTADLGVSQRDYRGVSRQDDMAEAGASVRFLANRFLELHSGYSFSTRNSSASGADYDAHTVFLGLTAQF